MPMHDWTLPDAGLYHHFHQSWAVNLAQALNAGVLPVGFFALVEMKAFGREPDILALNRRPSIPPAGNLPPGGVAVAEAPPQVRHVSRLTDADSYADRANKVGIRTRGGRLVALVELVSPGNKDSRHGIEAFVRKALEFLDAGVHLLVVDPFPPTPRDPAGIHKAIWDDIREESYTLPPDKPLTLASYVAAPDYTAYVESIAVGDRLPPMPLFLDSSRYVQTPLEESYQQTWDRCPPDFRDMVLHPTDE